MMQNYTSDHIELIALKDVPLVESGDDLTEIILRSIENSNQGLQDNDIIVMAQKIVSKSEGRLVQLDQVQPSKPAQELAKKSDKDPALVELILQESTEIVRQVEGLIIARHNLGFVMANAGIDQSNVAVGTALLLPIDPDKSANDICAALKKRHNVEVSVIISDSMGRAWRNGIVGHAIGVSGLPSVIDLRESEDLFGRKLKVTEVAVADELAAAATLLMGQGAEGKPIVVIRGLCLPDCQSSEPRGAAALVRLTERDLFR